MKWFIYVMLGYGIGYFQLENLHTILLRDSVSERGGRYSIVKRVTLGPAARSDEDQTSRLRACYGK